MNKNILKLLISFVPFLLATLGCGPAPPPPQEPPPPFVSIAKVSNGTPEIGEAVTVRWQFREDVRPELGPKLTRQVIQIISLTIDGGAFFDTRGCFPEGHPFLAGQPPGECISADEREVQFNFSGPVLFRLVAFSDEQYAGTEDNVSYIRAIKFTLPNMSFTVDLDHIHNDAYPTIFGRTTGMAFERAFGIYEVADPNDVEDGIIDEAAPGTELGQVFPTTVETLDGQTLAPMFFGSSSRPEESENFGFRKGGNFPLLQGGFLDTPNGQFFRDVKSHANMIIVGGSIRFDGDEVERVKADVGGEVVVTAAANLSLLFVQVDVRSANISPPQHIICDLHVITPRQGLVFSTFAGHNSPLSPPTLGTNEVSVDASQTTFKSTGMIKNALTGFDILLTGGTSFTPAQANVSVNWTNIPIYPDNDISGLENTFVKFVKDP